MTPHSIAAAFPPVDQHYLLQARQMQALSFSVHIPLVAFGLSFPAMVLFVEWLGRRRGDELYLTLARRWSKVMLTLFAVGVITGTVLSFEMGLLWPNFTGTFGSVFGLGFTIEGFSFFLEAIFIGIYVYGWRRLSPRAHLLSGIPIVITGITGSLLVIAVNAWMNHPGGFSLRNGKVVNVHPLRALLGNSYLWNELIHMYVAAYVVTGFIVAGCYAFGWLRGRWGRYERTALTVALTFAALASIAQAPIGDWAAREVASTQPVKLAAMEGPIQDDSRSVRAPSRLVSRQPAETCHPDPASALDPRRSQLERDGGGTRLRSGQPAAPGERGALVVPDHGGDRNIVRAPRRLVRRVLDQAKAPARVPVVLSGARFRRTTFGCGADRRLACDRGRPTAVGGLSSNADRRSRHGCARHPCRLRRACPRVPGGSERARLGTPTPRTSPAGPVTRILRPTKGGVGHVSSVATNGVHTRRAHAVHRARRRRPRGRLLAAPSRSRPARTERSRVRTPSNGARVGGEPCLADLRADRLLDLLPQGVRLDHVHSRGAPVHRPPRHPLSRRLLRDAGRGRDAAGIGTHRHAVRTVLDPRPRSHSARRSAASRPTACRSATPPGICGRAGSTRRPS